MFVIVQTTVSLESTVTSASDAPLPLSDAWPFVTQAIDLCIRQVGRVRAVLGDRVVTGRDILRALIAVTGRSLHDVGVDLEVKATRIIGGLRSLTTVIEPVRRVFVIVQTTVSLESTVTPPSDAPLPLSDACPLVVQAIDLSYFVRSVPFAPSSEIV